MKNTIYFDMDGTLADLFAQPNWIESLAQQSTAPYDKAEPLLRMSALARRLNSLQRKGYRIGVISWLSKVTTPEFDQRAREAKAEWLRKRLPSVHWDEMHLVPYGTPKQNYCTSPEDVLFDDNRHVRADWTGRAYDVQNILEILKEIEIRG